MLNFNLRRYTKESPPATPILTPSAQGAGANASSSAAVGWSSPGAMKKHAYVVLSYGDDARSNICPTLVAAYGIRQVVSNATAVIIMRIGVPIAAAELPAGVEQRHVQPPRTSGRYQWKHSFAKFWIAEMYEFDAVAFLDFDVLLFKPLDVMLDLADEVADSVVSPRAYWLGQPYGTSGTFVVSPLKDGVVNTAFLSTLQGSLGPSVLGRSFDGEMDWFNADKEVTDNVALVSGFYTLLCGEFFPGDGVYQYWGKRLQKTPEEILDSAHLVHFIAGWKPWASGIGEAHGNETPQLKRIYGIWEGYRANACARV